MLYGSQNTAFLLGFLDLLGVSIILPHLVVNLKEKCASPIAYGLFGTAYGIVQTLGAPIFNVISVIQGRKKAIVLTFYITGLAYFFLSFNGGLVYFFVTRATAGIAKHTQAMLKAYLSENSPKHNHRGVLDKFNVISKLGFVAGPIVGGYVTKFDQACIIVCVLFMACAVVANVLLLDPRYSSRYADAMVEERMPAICDTIKTVDWPRFWKTFDGRFLLGLAAGVYQSNLGFELVSRYTLTTTQLACIASFMGAVAIAADFLAVKVFQRCNGNTDMLLVSCISVLTASLVLLSVTSSPTKTLMLLFGFQASSSFAAALELEMAAARGAITELMVPLQVAADRLIPIVFAVTPFVNGCLHMIHPGLPAMVAAVVASAAGAVFFRKKRRPIQ